ncbi:unnamed protein product [Zymoseptoria tritici ST99CH_3D7]|uniref:Uncharacterized protein n=1 Tax=Zymoseptoria tritici (strain ST99CH_3D7) TaxID=1276538 RepID=A0A1X7RSB5_ZYMT9|nr:unnamed protein product [Zymoseptoria tritici ST99CH_3D7]
MTHSVPSTLQLPSARSKYHLFTGLPTRLLQHTPLGKPDRTIAWNTISATPLLPCEVCNTANLSRYGTSRDGSLTPGGISQVRIAAPSYCPAMIRPARRLEMREREQGKAAANEVHVGTVLVVDDFVEFLLEIDKDVGAVSPIFAGYSSNRIEYDDAIQ